MAKRKWSEAVDRGINACRSGKYVYFYGAKDIVLTKDLMDYYWNASPGYFKRYNSEEKAQIYRNSIGRKAVDCSGFTGWVCTGDKQYSIGQINNCYKYNSLAAGPTGSLLFTSWGGTGRHIGLDIGNGYCLQAGYESTDKNIALGRAGIYLSPISATAWEKSGQSNVIDYSGAFSPYPPTTQLIDDIYHPKHPTGIVKTDLYLRTGPGIVNPAILVMPEGAVVTIHDEAKAPDGGTWGFVDYKGTLGWCNKAYLTIN